MLGTFLPAGEERVNPFDGLVSLWETFGAGDVNPEMKNLHRQGWLEKETTEVLGRQQSWGSTCGAGSSRTAGRGEDMFPNSLILISV